MNTVENVRVVIRVRPLSKRELDLKRLNMIQVDAVNQQIAINKQGTSTSLSHTRLYTFDHIFDENSTQSDVYSHVAFPIVDQIMLGYNGTIFAYGQTGTGKTYTMTGLRAHKQCGIIPNTFAHIFTHIGKSDDGVRFLVHATYYEIYNEEVRDLLTLTPSTKHLDIREHSEFGLYVQNLSGYVVHTLEELERLMEIGDKNRSTGSTEMNSTSSRSHSIFTITIESSDTRINGGGVIRGKLHLVDLAGSERQCKSGATGLRFKEATKINQSLSVLGNVISALVDCKSSHIPYRDSKLTRLLQDSLGGNSKTVMITTISPSEFDYEETICTLRYANRAKNIKNHTHVNSQPKDALLVSFQKEIEELRKQLGNIDVTSNECTVLKTKKRRTKRSKRTSSATSTTDISTCSSVYLNMIEENEELSNAKIEQKKLQEKLQKLTNKVIVGGENLIEKAENQELILKISASKLNISDISARQLKARLQQCEDERIDIEERYLTLQDEVNGKTKKIKRMVALIADLEDEQADLEHDNQRELEGILDNARQLTHELSVAELIVDQYIPKEYQTLIESNIHWNEDRGDYDLKFTAHAGNNLRRHKRKTKKYVHVTNPYKQYASS